MVVPKACCTCAAVPEKLTKVRLRASIPAGPNDYWMVPLTVQPGLYTVKIGVFNASWAHMYFWDNNAATIAIAD